MPDMDHIASSLTPGALRLVEMAQEKQREGHHAQICANHWLLALLERHGPMAESMTRGLEAQSAIASLRQQLQQGATGAPLEVEAVVQQAVERAQRRGKEQAAERDLAAVILSAVGYELTNGSAAPLSAPPLTGTVSAAGQDNGQAGKTAPASGAAFQPRATRPTPTLDHFGRDLTRAALEGKLTPLIGREEEIRQMVETLCRHTKPNPVLIGPAGTGKTAIVEGLAQRIARGEVPTVLRGARIIAVQPSNLVAGASVQGELEKRMQALLAEASQDGIILFIDEVHSLIGAGGMPGSGDMASLLKPALARGELACIAATTDDEYRRFIEPDKALERRFNPVPIQELNTEQTLAVLQSLREQAAQRDRVQVPDGILRWLVDFAGRFMRNRYFPDKAVDLLEQCVAHAVAEGKESVGQADAQVVVERMVGMPLAIDERLDGLKEAIVGRALLTEEDADALLHRLHVTISGLDLRPARPNAIALLLDEVAANGKALAETIAGTLFGAEGRVVTIDFSQFVTHFDVSLLLGAPPGYVGYSDSLALHEVARMPWCVLVCDNLHACHPQVLEVLTQGLTSGFITDARGKRIYLSDTVTLLTARVNLEETRAMGFRNADGKPVETARVAAVRALSAALVDQCDLLCARGLSVGETQRRWLQQSLLSDLTRRYRQHGLDLRWDDSLIEWLLSQQQARSNQRDWERLVDDRISAMLIPYLPPADSSEARALLVKFAEGAICVEEGNAASE